MVITKEDKERFLRLVSWIEENLPELREKVKAGKLSDILDGIFTTKLGHSSVEMTRSKDDGSVTKGTVKFYIRY